MLRKKFYLLICRIDTIHAPKKKSNEHGLDYFKYQSVRNPILSLPAYGRRRSNLPPLSNFPPTPNSPPTPKDAPDRHDKYFEKEQSEHRLNRTNAFIPRLLSAYLGVECLQPSLDHRIDCLNQKSLPVHASSSIRRWGLHLFCMFLFANWQLTSEDKETHNQSEQNLKNLKRSPHVSFLSAYPQLSFCFFDASILFFSSLRRIQFSELKFNSK